MSTCAMVDTTSTSIMEASRDTVEIPKRDGKGKKSKKKKKHKMKSHRDDDMPKEEGSSSTVLEETTTTIEQDSSQQHETKSKKKKKKKDKKRKRKDTAVDNTTSIINDEDDNPLDDSDGKRSKKKKKRTSSVDKHLSQKEMDEKVVASSAIEYYPENLKSLQLKKNKEEKIAALSVENKDDNSEKSSVVEDTKKKSKSKKKSKHKEDKVSNNGMENGDGKEHTSSKPNDDKASKTSSSKDDNSITLLLFYQYVEPPWDEAQFQNALTFVTTQGNKHGITGRMRVAREGLNCTLTGSYDGIRSWCTALRNFDGGRSTIDPISGNKQTEFSNTEFKLTDDLPPKQRFPKLHAFEVVELVNYGLAGSRAPTISQHGGTHLEPSDYHTKMCESDTVIIDVRNHYEANIGRFDPPEGGAKMIDPKMRKSTEFPIWLEKNKEMLRGKQVLMYCTGGVRCERASALLKQKIDKEEDTKQLGIKGVYQLQGGVDKYFKEFPTGGLWKGKNYTFDKRFAHAPPAVEAVERTKKVLGEEEVLDNDTKLSADQVLGKCEACQKPWDMYRGKRRCPTCGVPSLICRECFEADRAGTRKLGREVRCDLCVEEDVRNKRELREREEREMKEYEEKLRSKLDDEYEPPTQRKHAITRKPKPNPERITRLFLKNMCAKQMDEARLLEALHPAKVTHIQWLTDRNTGQFYGSAFIEVKTPEDAGSVLALDGSIVLGRKIKVKYQQADSKDIWPIKNTEVSSS